MQLLYVDDQPLVVRALVRGLSLGRGGISVSGATGAEEALALLASRSWDVVLSDFAMPEIDGVDFLREVRSRLPSARRLILTGKADHPKVKAALDEGFIEKVLAKPVSAETLREALGISSGSAVSEDEA